MLLLFHKLSPHPRCQHTFPHQSNSLGHSDSAFLLWAEAVGRDERLLDGHGETPPLGLLAAVGGGRDGHQRDSVRDPRTRRVWRRHRGHDVLVVTVATANRDGEELDEGRDVAFKDRV